MRGLKSPLLLKKMIAKSKIDTLVNGFLADKDIFLVDCLVSPTNKIQVYVDSLNGLSVKDCVNLSRHIESSLNQIGRAHV